MGCEEHPKWASLFAIFKQNNFDSLLKKKERKGMSGGGGGVI